MKGGQRGVGMVEILVALVVLAVGVLGYVVLQVRALEATSESTQRIKAVNIARDFAERVRVNRSGWTSPTSYISEMSNLDQQEEYETDCAISVCSAQDIADYDVAQIYAYATENNMELGMEECPNTENRYCLFVAWGDTAAKNKEGSENNACTDGNSYEPQSTCLIMEIY